MNNPQLMLAITCILSTVLSIFPAQAKGPLLHKVKTCSQLEADTQRLACYDKLAADIAARPHPAPRHTETNSKTAFGLEHKKEGDQEISATLSDVSKSPNGQRRFTLDNQQRWQQIGTQAFFAKEGDAVVIRRGSFNSFIMQKVGSNRTIKVRRVD
ncbi:MULTISPECIES: hypothetical protein [unclassified Pseudoalteromonas]|uniref:hypothetical protein n=1 Tax=unclassified Pseudoalteromonas TaxID=194690 RepID=UPI0020985B44|nr:hypothetical protein [Pseudoalteromonas sp. XMcav2-N]MCO7190099.1 hypothetical protein [Pseudoalteromonas sp. XMcav2-N]